MKLCEDDLTQDTGQPEREPAEEPGKYYYDDSTGYELYEPTPSSEEDGGEGQGATVNPADCYGGSQYLPLHLVFLAVLFLWSFIGP